MDKVFKITERGSNYRKEIVGGLTTFFAVAYIIFVNPAQVAVQFIDINGILETSGSAMAAWRAIAPAVIAFAGLIIISVLTKIQMKGAVLGTSTCTTFVESASGVAAGARTGFASLVTSICFLLCLFLTPLASIVPSCATAPALIFVGVLMLKNFANVDMSDMRSSVPAFLTLIMMPLTYSISNGIGIGCISYILITLFTGKYTKKDVVATPIALIFVAKFAFVTM